MDEIILMSDERVAAVPVRECGESLVDPRLNGSVLTLRPRSESAGL